MCKPCIIFLFVVVFSNVCKSHWLCRLYTTFSCRIFIRWKLCNLINKPDIEVLLVKLTTEANQAFSLQKNFQITWLCFKQQKVLPTNRISSRHIWIINKPRQKIIMKNLFSVDERFGVLHEDTEVRNATFASNKIMQSMCHGSWGSECSTSGINTSILWR